jgi:choloylglycine hydrolase
MKFLAVTLRVNLALIIITCSNTIFACTDFKVLATDGTIVITRSMEFAADLKSNLRSSPRGRKFISTAPDGKPGLAWTAQYGYVYLDGMNLDYTIDGMNEQGLTFEALYLPGLAKYQDVDPKQDGQALPYIYLGDWALSNFKTVDEVRTALANVTVFAQPLPGTGDMISPLHFSFYDANGKGLIVEYINGKLNMYDNQIGVLTNAPEYPWHVTNLNNYTYLRPTNPNPVVDKGITFTAIGQGGGMLGLPGDITPPSRFVKTSVLMAVVYPAANATEAVNLAEHVINNVDIPFGLARELSNGNYSSEFTQWVIFKDITNKKIYYRTYKNLTLRVVAMSKVNFAPGAASLKMPITTDPYVLDVTDIFLKQSR